MFQTTNQIGFRMNTRKIAEDVPLPCLTTMGSKPKTHQVATPTGPHGPPRAPTAPTFRARTLSPPRQPSPQVTTVPYLSGLVMTLCSAISNVPWNISIYFNDSFSLIVGLIATNQTCVGGKSSTSMVQQNFWGMFHCHRWLPEVKHTALTLRTGPIFFRRVCFLNPNGRSKLSILTCDEGSACWWNRNISKTACD